MAPQLPFARGLVRLQSLKGFNVPLGLLVHGRVTWLMLDCSGFSARAMVYELQGDLTFAASETVARLILEASAAFERVIIDFRRVFRVDPASVKLIAVNGREFNFTVLRDAVKATASSQQPLALLIKNGEYYQTFQID